MVTDMLSPSQKILIESIHIAGRDAKLGQDYEGVTVQVCPFCKQIFRDVSEKI